MINDGYPLPAPEKSEYSISFLHLFRVFQSREEASKAGIAVPPFDETRRPKYWMDENAAKLDPEEQVDYTGYAGTPGNWKKVPESMPAFEAATLNIPDKILVAEELGGRKVRPPLNCPIRPLNDNEAFPPNGGLLGVPIIIRPDLKIREQDQKNEFTVADRQRLAHIEEMLVSLTSSKK